MKLSKDLANKTQSDKVLREKAFKIASDRKYDGYQRRLALMVCKFFVKKSNGNGIANEPNYQLVNELHKPIIQKLKKRKVYSSFRDNIWGANLADMQSLSKYDKGKEYLLRAIDLFRILENAVFKHMTAIQQNICFDVLDDIVNEYNKMKPIDVTDYSSAEYNQDFNKRDPKFKVGDRVRISKYKNIFARGYTPNWSEEVFIVSGIKNTVP